MNRNRSFRPGLIRDDPRKPVPACRGSAVGFCFCAVGAVASLLFSAPPRLRDEPLLASQQNRRVLQLHRQLSRRLAINPAVNQRLRHQADRALNRPEVPEYVSQRKTPGPCGTHMQRHLGQDHSPLLLAHARRFLLLRMLVTDRLALDGRGFALLSVPAEQLAPPVIGVASLGHPRSLLQVRIGRFASHAFVKYQLPSTNCSLRGPPPPISQLGKQST